MMKYCCSLQSIYPHHFFYKGLKSARRFSTWYLCITEGEWCVFYSCFHVLTYLISSSPYHFKAYFCPTFSQCTIDKVCISSRSDDIYIINLLIFTWAICVWNDDFEDTQPKDKLKVIDSSEQCTTLTKIVGSLSSSTWMRATET